MSFYPTSQYLLRPSFMELNMTETLFPGFRDAILFLFSPNSRRTVGRTFDTLHSVIEIVHAFDKVNPSTASEKYLGFRRSHKNEDRTRLSLLQRLATIFEATIVPYLLSRPAGSDFEMKLTRLFKIFRATLATLHIIGITDTISPIQYLMGIRVSRIVETGPKSQTSYPQKIFTKLVWALIYGIQLAQWYYAHESVLVPSDSRMSCPVPYVSREGLPADPSLCGLCFKTRQNPTVLITSGHVYCYSCIWRWLSEKGAVCPVSGAKLPPTSDQLHYIRRLV